MRVPRSLLIASLSTMIALAPVRADVVVHPLPASQPAGAVPLPRIELGELCVTHQVSVFNSLGNRSVLAIRVVATPETSFATEPVIINAQLTDERGQPVKIKASSASGRWNAVPRTEAVAEIELVDAGSIKGFASIEGEVMYERPIAREEIIVRALTASQNVSIGGLNVDVSAATRLGSGWAITVRADRPDKMPVLTFGRLRDSFLANGHVLKCD